MERSSYLELFPKERLGIPYKSGREAAEEAVLSLLALMRLFEKTRAGAVSLEFAARDWLMTRMHLEGRGAGNFPVETVCSRLGLNRSERTALLLSLAVREGKIDGRDLSRMRGDQRKEAVSLAAAELLARFQGKLETAGRENPERIREEKAALIFSTGWKQENSLAEVWLTLRPRVLDEILGEGDGDGLSGSLRAFCRRYKGEESLPPPGVLGEFLEKLKRMCLGTKPEENWSLCFLGVPGSGREFLARHLAAFLGRNLLSADGNAIKGRFLEDAVRELLLECLLSGDLLYLKGPEEEVFYPLRRELSGLLITGARPEEMEERRGEDAACGAMEYLRRECLCLELAVPGPEEKARLWKEFLAGYDHEADLDPESLGSKYVLNAGGIKKALQAAEKWALGNGRKRIGNGDVAWAVHQSQAGQLGAFASQVPCVFGWEDLIVEETVRRQLDLICGQVKYRSIVGNQWGFFEKMPYGRGVSALFYGPPGTGKTMAVQVIAKDLGLDLYRVDLSRMVSKYIGETEKNISALFDKAKTMNAVLFFDEADSFFSRRFEVKDANDRSANAEVAHLLQKLEEYEGITILATNLKENIDDAFKRRIRFMVNFRFPPAETRKMLWHSLVPKTAPRSKDLDLDFFAEQFELSGSQIKEILLNAAYMAAGEGAFLGNGQVKAAICLNYEKYGKFLTKEDFGYLG